jgi:hypothetical protein
LTYLEQIRRSRRVLRRVVAPVFEGMRAMIRQNMMWKYLGAVSVIACAAASPALAGPFPATISIDTSETHLPPDPGFAPIDVSSASLPAGATLPYHGASFTTGSGASEETISFVGMDGTQQGIVNGAGSGVYAPPVTNSSGATYGGNYFSTGKTGYIDISFASPEKALALLWGSVDSTNQITSCKTA